MSEAVVKTEVLENQELSCACGNHATEGVGHARSMGRIRIAIIGGFLILNSYLFEWLFPDQVFASDLSAMIGAILLAFPILITAYKDLLVGHVHMNELVALAILAAMTSGDFKSAGLIGFLLLLSIIIESKTASGAQRSIEELIKLTPHTASLITEEGEVTVEATELKADDGFCLVAPSQTVRSASRCSHNLMCISAT